MAFLLALEEYWMVGETFRSLGLSLAWYKGVEMGPRRPTARPMMDMEGQRRCSIYKLETQGYDESSRLSSGNNCIPNHVSIVCTRLHRR